MNDVIVDLSNKLEAVNHLLENEQQGVTVFVDQVRDEALQNYKDRLEYLLEVAIDCEELI